MNISFLNSNGYKVSKIAALDEFQIASKVKEISYQGNTESHAFNAFKLAMLNFDQALILQHLQPLVRRKKLSRNFLRALHSLSYKTSVFYGKHLLSPRHMSIFYQLIFGKKY